MKVFGHMTSYRADLPFDAWFTRILVNACLDRAKARSRARRWLLPAGDEAAHWRPLETVAAAGPSPERRLLVAAKWQELSEAVRDAARPASATSSLLCHLDEQTPARGRGGPGHEPGHGARPPVPRPAQAAQGAGRPAMSGRSTPMSTTTPCACWRWIPAAADAAGAAHLAACERCQGRAATAARELDELPCRRRRRCRRDLLGRRPRPASSARFSPASAAATASPGCCRSPAEPGPLARASRSPLAGRRRRRRPGPRRARRPAAAPRRRTAARRADHRRGAIAPAARSRGPGRSRTRCSAKWKPRSTPTPSPELRALDALTPVHYEIR